MTENIFGENKEEENPVSILRGFRKGDTVEFNEEFYAIDEINSDGTVNLLTTNVHGTGFVRLRRMDAKRMKKWETR